MISGRRTVISEDTFCGVWNKLTQASPRPLKLLCLCEVEGEKVGVTVLSGYVKGPGKAIKLSGEAEG